MTAEIQREELEAFCQKLALWEQDIHEMIDYALATDPDVRGDEAYFNDDFELAAKIKQTRELLSEIKNMFYSE